MAEYALKKLEEQLNCSVCFDTYTNPKQLPCNHVYCQTCLVPLVQDQKISCPTCRRVTPVSARGVAGFQSAFHINHLLEILKEVKELSSAQQEGAVGSSANYCSLHGGKELELYCETCEVLICSHCGLKEGEHHSHDYKLLDKAIAGCKKEIALSLEPMKGQFKTINKVFAQIEVCKGEVSNQQVAVEADINSTIRRLHEVLNVRKAMLIGQLHFITQGKLECLDAQKSQIENALSQIRSFVSFMTESIKTENQQEVLKMKIPILNQIQELTNGVFRMPDAEADVAFTASAEVVAACQNYGQILVAGFPGPSKFHPTGKGVAVAVGEKSAAGLQATNFKGKLLKKPVKSPSGCETLSKVTHGQVRVRKVSSHRKLTINRRHPVEGSGTAILRVRTPWGIAINQRGEVVVTELEGHCVSVFSPSGEKLRSFATRGPRPGQLECPRGVAVDGEGNILVAGHDYHRIEKFSPEGAVVGAYGTGPLQLYYPHDIAFNASNNEVYAVDDSNRVHILNSDLTFSSTFGEFGSEKGQFDSPCSVACDITGKVYVADSGNNRIQVFTAEGKFLKMLSIGEQDSPIGVAVDARGLVYISDNSNHCILIFTSGGEFVTSFGREGEGPGEFEYPCGLAVDSSGVLYVADQRNNRVQFFK